MARSHKMSDSEAGTRQREADHDEDDAANKSPTYANVLVRHRLALVGRQF